MNGPVRRPTTSRPTSPNPPPGGNDGTPTCSSSSFALSSSSSKYVRAPSDMPRFLCFDPTVPTFDRIQFGMKALAGMGTAEEEAKAMRGGGGGEGSSSARGGMKQRLIKAVIERVSTSSLAAKNANTTDESGDDDANDREEKKENNQRNEEKGNDNEYEDGGGDEEVIGLAMLPPSHSVAFSMVGMPKVVKDLHMASIAMQQQQHQQQQQMASSSSSFATSSSSSSSPLTPSLSTPPSFSPTLGLAFSHFCELRILTDVNHPARGQYGLFAKRHIPQGIVLTPYAGTIQFCNLNPSSRCYVMSHAHTVTMEIDGEFVGNFARFANDPRGVPVYAPQQQQQQQQYAASSSSSSAVAFQRRGDQQQQIKEEEEGKDGQPPASSTALSASFANYYAPRPVVLNGKATNNVEAKVIQSRLGESFTALVTCRQIPVGQEILLNYGKGHRLRSQRWMSFGDERPLTRPRETSCFPAPLIPAAPTPIRVSNSVGSGKGEARKKRPRSDADDVEGGGKPSSSSSPIAPPPPLEAGMRLFFQCAHCGHHTHTSPHPTYVQLCEHCEAPRAANVALAVAYTPQAPPAMATTATATTNNPTGVGKRSNSDGKKAAAASSCSSSPVVSCYSPSSHDDVISSDNTKLEEQQQRKKEGSSSLPRPHAPIKAIQTDSMAFVEPTITGTKEMMLSSAMAKTKMDGGNKAVVTSKSNEEDNKGATMAKENTATSATTALAALLAPHTNPAAFNGSHWGRDQAHRCGGGGVTGGNNGAAPVTSPSSFASSSLFSPTGAGGGLSSPFANSGSPLSITSTTNLFFSSPTTTTGGSGGYGGGVYGNQQQQSVLGGFVSQQVLLDAHRFGVTSVPAPFPLNFSLIPWHVYDARIPLSEIRASVPQLGLDIQVQEVTETVARLSLKSVVANDASASPSATTVTAKPIVKQTIIGKHIKLTTTTTTTTTTTERKEGVRSGDDDNGVIVAVKEEVKETYTVTRMGIATGVRSDGKVWAAGDEVGTVGGIVLHVRDERVAKRLIPPPDVADGNGGGISRHHPLFNPTVGNGFCALMAPEKIAFGIPLPHTFSSSSSTPLSSGESTTAKGEEGMGRGEEAMVLLPSNEFAHICVVPSAASLASSFNPFGQQRQQQKGPAFLRHYAFTADPSARPNVTFTTSIDHLGCVFVAVTALRDLTHTTELFVSEDDVMMLY